MTNTTLDVTVLLGDPRLPDTYKPGRRFNPEDLENVQILERSLSELDGYSFTYFDDHPNLLAQVLEHRPDLVLNLCDTGFRNNARLELHVPALLELLDIPCTGAGPFGMVLVYDKGITRSVADSLGVPVPIEVFLASGSMAGLENARFPALIKPARTDGSLGITQDAVVDDAQAAERYIESLWTELPEQDVLVQEFLSGSEYGIGLIGNPEHGFEVLPPLEVDYSGLDSTLPRILGYESKAFPDSPYWTDIKYRRAQTLAEALYERMVADCKRLFARLECRDYARFDFRTDSAGSVKLLEVNTNPAWAHDAKLNLMASFASLSHGQMLGLILGAARQRCRL